MIGGEVTAVRIPLPLLFLDLVSWATAQAQSYRVESEDTDWTENERTRFIHQAESLEVWIASDRSYDISRDVNPFLALRSTLRPHTNTSKSELDQYAQVLVQVAETVPLAGLIEPQFVLDADNGELWITDVPSLHSARRHVGSGVEMHDTNFSGINAVIAILNTKKETI